MPHPTIEEFGLALYGPDWKPPIEQLLGVKERTLRRWMAEPSAVPEGVTEELYAVVLERAELLKRLLAQKEEGGFQRQVMPGPSRPPQR